MQINLKTKKMRHSAWPSICLFLFVHIGFTVNLCAASADNLRHLIGKNDSLLIASPRQEILFEKNADKKLVPASILKLFTALVAFHYLGPGYGFPTDFYLDEDKNLRVKGYGDPLLVSERLQDIAEVLSKRLSMFKHLYVDDSFFHSPVHIPGTSPTYQPYDAPNGALCVNFNTVYFKRTGNIYVSAEPQTPLLPFVHNKIKASNLDHGRIVLSHQNSDITLYAGHLLKYFLLRKGVHSNGQVLVNQALKQNDRALMTYTSPATLKQAVAMLLEFSNNFIANQILIAAGAKAYGPPGTLEKGCRAALEYAGHVLGINDISFVEGSGISRNNSISARNLLKILNEFEKHRFLMRHQDSEFYKTGNLAGVMTRAGYLTDIKNNLYPYVVMLNTPGKSTNTVMRQVRRIIRMQQ